MQTVHMTHGQTGQLRKKYIILNYYNLLCLCRIEAMFAKMKNFTLARLTTDLADFLSTFFVSLIYSFSIILRIQQEKLSK